MITYLKNKSYYQHLYDRTTVEFGRRDQAMFTEFFDNFFKKFPEEDPKRPGMVLYMNVTYMAIAGHVLLDRYDNRDTAIHRMMASDEAKDTQLAAARLATEPACQHCGKTKLRLTDKNLLNRGDNDNDSVLFILRCPYCKKNSAYWEDGSEWEHRQVRCPECSAVMDEKDARKGKVITTTYTCPSCDHTYKDTLDLRSKKETPDPDFEKDREIFCLQDEKIRDELRDAKYRFEGMAKLGKEIKERKDNKELYDAVANLEKLKIPQLIERLRPVIEKAGYIEVTFDKPEIGKDVVVGFNCMDSDSTRDDAKSRKVLKKAIDAALGNSNWRLMSNGISYRLGYLNGRLKAYEGESNLLKLVKGG